MRSAQERDPKAESWATSAFRAQGVKEEPIKETEKSIRRKFSGKSQPLFGRDTKRSGFAVRFMSFSRPYFIILLYQNLDSSVCISFFLNVFTWLHQVLVVVHGICVTWAQ